MGLGNFAWELFSIIRRARTWITGRDIALKYLEENGKQPSYGSLYTTLRDLMEADLIESRVDNDEDGPVRSFRVTTRGRGITIPLKKKQTRKQPSAILEPDPAA